jgi:hypothetical protein
MQKSNIERELIKEKRGITSKKESEDNKIKIKRDKIVSKKKISSSESDESYEVLKKKTTKRRNPTISPENQIDLSKELKCNFNLILSKTKEKIK